MIDKWKANPSIDPRAFLVLDDCLYDNSWTKDKNIRSLFGNYADYNVNRLEKLNQILHRKRLEDPGFMWKPTSFLGREYKYRQGLGQEQQGIKTRIQNQLSEAAQRQETAGGDAGYTLSQLQDPGPKGDYAAARARTSSRVGPGGNVRAYGLAQGGRVGYNRGGRVGILAAF